MPSTAMVLDKPELRSQAQALHEGDTKYTCQMMKFWPHDIELFDPDRKGPFVETKDNEEVFCNVFVIINQIRAWAEIYDPVVY
jgi:hypothetical protein